ncbi:MAG: SET domain-containing protein [Thermodesulfobacteriota bacterium]
MRQVAGKGRGVFALRPFRQGQLIERAPVIVMEEDPWELLNQTSLRDYYFAWGGDRIAVVLGFGSLYNHSALPNARAERRIGQDVVDFIAARDIRAGEEITFCYDCPPWFEIHDE